MIYESEKKGWSTNFSAFLGVRFLFTHNGYIMQGNSCNCTSNRLMQRDKPFGSCLRRIMSERSERRSLF